MNVKSYGFFGGCGAEYTRGWQGTEEQARALAQSLANIHGDTVEAVLEPCRYDHDKDMPAEPEFVCEPESD